MTDGINAGGIEAAKTHRIQRLREENRRLRERLAATDLTPVIEALDEARRALASVGDWQGRRTDSHSGSDRPGEWDSVAVSDTGGGGV